jgi:CHAT domain-containing protein/Flp pilus assembly protein TadD
MRWIAALRACLVLAALLWVSSAWAQSADFLAALQQYRVLTGAGEFQKALPYAKRLVTLSEKEFGADNPNTAVSLNSLGLVYRGLGRLKEAEATFREALAIVERARGPDHPDLIVSLNNIASTLIEGERFNDAEPLLRRAQAIGAAKLPDDNPLRVDTLASLARIAWTKGDLSGAEVEMKQVVAAREKTLGVDHPRFADALHNLGVVYRLEGRNDEAEQILLRALAIRERVLGPDHPDVASSLDTLASLATAQDKLDLAEQRYKRAIKILDHSLGEAHPRTLDASVNLAGLYLIKKDFPAAEAIVTRAIAIEEKAGGPDNPQLAQPLEALADIYSVQEKHSLAEPLRRRVLVFREQTVGPNDPDTATELVNLATDVAALGRTEDALALARRASTALIGRATHAVEEQAIAGQSEQLTYRYVFLKDVELAALLQAQRAQPDPRLIDEAFASGQMAQSVDTARAVNRMAVRFAVGDSALALKVRQRQDLSDRRQQLDHDLYRRIGQRDAVAQADIARLRTALRKADDDLKRLDGEIAKAYPAYAELVATRPVTIAEVQALLGPNEAVASLVVDRAATYLWIVTPKRVLFRALKIGSDELDAIVARLREGLDLSRSPDIASAKFDIGLAYKLYRALFAEATPALAGVDHLIVIASGALQSLPPAVLVTADPSAAKGDYRAVHWLIDQTAISVLPSVQTLASLRRLPRGERAGTAFLGIGDPVLGTPAAPSRDTTRALLARSLPPLPETADELRTIATELGSGADNVLLRERATKRQIATMDLAKYRVIAFATHGLMAGDFKGLAEPALVLTPGAGASDDGLLTASDITRLRVNADLVVLSACNTAAPDGRPGAEGFSGLAKAFFYAGSRALLVSHWPVASEAAIRLTTGTIGQMASAHVGPAEGLRRAMRALRDDRGDELFAYPGIWAPFVVVGEGGLER